MAFVSKDGGASWSETEIFATIKDHIVAGRLRASPLISAEIDAAGKVYAVWQDCRFRKKCVSNDIVMSTSSDGVTWSRVVRIPIDPTSSTVDHFIPGIAVDKTTYGSSARIGVIYFYYPNTACSASACQLYVGYVSSPDGGVTWTTPSQLAGPMTLSWLPNTFQGRMVGDFISTSFNNSRAAYGVFPVVFAPGGGTDCYNPTASTTNCDKPLYVPAGGAPQLAATIVAGLDQPSVGVSSQLQLTNPQTEY